MVGRAAVRLGEGERAVEHQQPHCDVVGVQGAVGVRRVALDLRLTVAARGQVGDELGLGHAGTR